MFCINLLLYFSILVHLSVIKSAYLVFIRLKISVVLLMRIFLITHIRFSHTKITDPSTTPPYSHDLTKFTSFPTANSQAIYLLFSLSFAIGRTF